MRVRYVTSETTIAAAGAAFACADDDFSDRVRKRRSHSRVGRALRNGLTRLLIILGAVLA